MRPSRRIESRIASPSMVILPGRRELIVAIEPSVYHRVAVEASGTRKARNAAKGAKGLRAQPVSLSCPFASFRAFRVPNLSLRQHPLDIDGLLRPGGFDCSEEHRGCFDVVFNGGRRGWAAVEPGKKLVDQV